MNILSERKRLSPLERLIESMRRMRKLQSEWQHIEDVTQARVMIASARTRYERAKAEGKNVTGWSPERVLSVTAGFKKLCRALNDESTWKLLNRKERAFIAAAVDFVGRAK